MVFERLAQGFDYVSAEFWEFVEEKHAVVGERDFAWARVGTAADESGIGHSPLGS